MDIPIEAPDVDRPGIIGGDGAPDGDRAPDGDKVPGKDDLPDGDRIKGNVKRALVIASGIAEAGRVINVEKSDDDNNLIVDVVLSKKNYSGDIPHEQIARARALLTAKAENPLAISLNSAIRGEGLKPLAELKEKEKLGNRPVFIEQISGADVPDTLQTGEYLYKVEVLGRRLGPYEEK